VEQLNGTIQDLQKQWNEVSKDRRSLESQKQNLEIELRDDLKLKLDQLNNQEIDSSTNGGSANLKALQLDLKRTEQAAAETETKLNETEVQIEQGETEITKQDKVKTSLIERQQDLARDIERQQKRMEKSVAKKALLTASASETAKNIRDLGVLPEEAFEKYVNHDSKVVSVASIVHISNC
jgi:structural maintenance of chromosome 3 (chondroitin sulfate proteoglycan 6)